MVKIVSLPFELYYHFILEEKYGFNKITLKLFIIDEIKSFLLNFIIMGIFLKGFIAMVAWGGV